MDIAMQQCCAAKRAGQEKNGEMTPDQSFNLRPLAGWADYRTPVPGLYLCGSGAFPGGGVTGIPGHNAAQAVIADLKRS